MSVHKDKETYTKIKQLLDIPPDEPIFIIRAQDRFSIEALQSYRGLVWYGTEPRTDVLHKWRDDVESIISDFMNWQRDNKEKVKVPD